MQTKKTNENNAKVKLYNEDCITGAKQHIADKCVDLIICDPPFGIKEGKFCNQYNRKHEHVIAGYCEAPNDYFEFSKNWIGEAKRILREDGSMYIISGWSELRHILNAIEYNQLSVINHLIWKYNFGLYTQRKYVSSHYHILFINKSAKSTFHFNPSCRFGRDAKTNTNGSAQYQDLEDVWTIRKEFQKGRIKNINKLPDELVKKMIQYSSAPGHTVCDFFMGNFTTAKVAISLNRNVVGFEINVNAYNAFTQSLGITECLAEKEDVI